MKVKILQTFDGYPDGTGKSLTTYTVGKTVEVPDAFGKLIIGKGHAVDAGPALAPAAAVPPHDKQG